MSEPYPITCCYCGSFIKVADPKEDPVPMLGRCCHDRPLYRINPKWWAPHIIKLCQRYAQ